MSAPLYRAGAWKVPADDPPRPCPLERLPVRVRERVRAWGAGIDPDSAVVALVGLVVLHAAMLALVVSLGAIAGAVIRALA